MEKARESIFGMQLNLNLTCSLVVLSCVHVVVRSHMEVYVGCAISQTLLESVLGRKSSTYHTLITTTMTLELRRILTAMNKLREG